MDQRSTPSQSLGRQRAASLPVLCGGVNTPGMPRRIGRAAVSVSAQHLRMLFLQCSRSLVPILFASFTSPLFLGSLVPARACLTLLLCQWRSFKQQESQHRWRLWLQRQHRNIHFWFVATMPCFDARVFECACACVWACLSVCRCDLSPPSFHHTSHITLVAGGGAVRCVLRFFFVSPSFFFLLSAGCQAGDVVQVHGSNFEGFGSVAVTVGGEVCTQARVVSNWLLTCRLPDFDGVSAVRERGRER